jgi:D-lactate dehydrogenase (cytochrome)
VIRAVRPRYERPPPVLTDRDLLQGYLEDASGAPAGKAKGLVRPASEAEASAFLRQTVEGKVPVLFQAARTSLTGGAIPDGEIVLSVEKMSRIGPVQPGGGGDRVTVQPGVRLETLQEHLRDKGLFFPPVPTYQQAMLGGAVSTNAGGSATFKYGVTRQWVRSLRVLLFNGDLLEIERGESRVSAGETFDIELSDRRRIQLPAPDYSLPPLKKISAGYHASDPMDLVDLFIGAEGTLGLISSVTVDLAPLPDAVLSGFAFAPSDTAALSLAGDLRAAALEARARQDPKGPDIRSIEFLDGNCLSILAGEQASRLRIPIPANAGAALFFEMEIAGPAGEESIHRDLARVLDGASCESAPGRLFRVLERHGAIEDLQLAFPGDRERAQSLAELREAAPVRTNEILTERRRLRPGIKKVGGDLIVPFEHLPEMMGLYREGFERRGLAYAIWGHLSDGNLHPNALPRTADEVVAGFDALLEFGSHAARLGGCPLSEHGVGRNPVKQEMMRRFLGDAAIETMRKIKRALDPPGRFAPGVLFSPSLPEALE